MFILHGRLSQEFGTYTKHGPGCNKGGLTGGGIGVFPIELQFESVGMKILGVEMH